MARTVVDSWTVAHLWANQSQPHARTSTNNLSFQGPILTSYTTPIAALATYRGERICLLSSVRYSNTTAKQLSYARQAVRGETRIIYVEAVPHSETYLTSKALVDWLRKESGFLKTAADRAFQRAGAPGLRSNSRAAWYRDAVAAADAYDAFNSANGLKRKPYPRPDLASVQIAVEQANIRKQRAAAAAAKRAVKEWRIELDKWFAGERQSAPGTQPGLSYGEARHYLRVFNPGTDNPTIQTTLGVSVTAHPLAIAELLSIFDELRNNGTISTITPTRRDRFHQLVGYTLDGINYASGYIAVGCHRFAFSELDRFANVLLSFGLLSQPIPAPFVGSIDPLVERHRQEGAA